MRFPLSQVTLACVKLTKTKQYSVCGLYWAHALSSSPLLLLSSLPSTVMSFFFPSKFLNLSQIYPTTRELNLER